MMLAWGVSVLHSTCIARVCDHIVTLFREGVARMFVDVYMYMYVAGRTTPVRATLNFGKTSG